MKKILIITCEHGGNKIPRAYQSLFIHQQRLLDSHYGWDIGALRVAKQIAKQVGDYFFYTQVSRLLIELNRSLGHRQLFSQVTQPLSDAEKQKILTKYYFPYRNNVEHIILKEIGYGHKVIHLSVHSFTPVLNAQVRNFDIGLLYDPARKSEKEFCKAWKSHLRSLDKGLEVRSNQPYMGKSDGFVTYLRKKFNKNIYIGVELEINQKCFRDENNSNSITNLLISALKGILH